MTVGRVGGKKRANNAACTTGHCSNTAVINAGKALGPVELRIGVVAEVDRCCPVVVAAVVLPLKLSAACIIFTRTKLKMAAIAVPAAVARLIELDAVAAFPSAAGPKKNISQKLSSNPSQKLRLESLQL